MMNIKRKFLIITTTVLAVLPALARAESSSKPVQLALFNPVQIVDRDTAIGGVRLNLLYGVNSEMKGLSYGFINHTTGDRAGVEIGVFNFVDGNAKGWHHGFVNIVIGHFTGFQGGFYNGSDSSQGVTYGVVNITRSMNGFQLGLFNMTDSLHGLQIGLINVVKDRKKLPVFRSSAGRFDAPTPKQP